MDWAGLGWAGLGWAGLGWAGLDWTGLGPGFFQFQLWWRLYHGSRACAS